MYHRRARPQALRSDLPLKNAVSRWGDVRPCISEKQETMREPVFIEP